MLINLFRPFHQGSRPENSNSPLAINKIKELAVKLSDRNLSARAARVWQEYLSAADNISDVERAKVLYQIGVLLEKTGSYEDAIEYFYRSEMTAGLSELESQINTHVKECFEKLGQFSALRYELMDRTSMDKSRQAGDKIVAEIGPEKFTEADLDSVIEKAIDNQLSGMAAFMTTEQLHEQKKKILDQYKDPSARLDFLRSWLAEEVLYRQALADKLSEQPDVKSVIDDVVRSVLSRRFMDNELADKINITETDLQTYYQAHKDEYMESAKASISHILVESKQQANDLKDRLKNGDDFNELAKEFSTDSATKDKGGEIKAEVAEGTYVSGIGEFEELNRRIFAANAGDILAEPFKTDKGWEIIKVREKTAKRQKKFDEVRQQVITELLSQKRRDVQAGLIQQMMDRYNVIVHTSAFKGAEQNNAELPDNTSAGK
ncbi:MAG: peptidyl-prolyl cis-trans isomerase [Sedimentisphaerales bacterium]|nr:peptidyl-prolyl cis-trans isomerase [Sedimentisphaerales bacterium]